MSETLNEKKNNKALLVVFMLIGIIVAAVVALVVSGTAHSLMPEVMEGEQGLLEMRKYLYILLSRQLITVIWIPLFFVILCIIYYRLEKLPIRPVFVLLAIVAGILCCLTVVPIRLTGIELQGERFSEDRLQQIFLLRDAVNEDMDESPVVVCEDAFLQVSKERYYSDNYKIVEYCLLDQKGERICQISEQEYEYLEPRLCELSSHTVRCYPNSGLLYDIDNGEDLPLESELIESVYAITYDADGFIRWEGPANGVQLPNLSMRYYIDGELRLDRSMENRTEDDPLFLNGRQNVAYMSALYKGEYVRVSNILEVTQIYDRLGGKDSLEDVTEEEQTRGNGTPVMTVRVPEIEAEKYLDEDYLVTAEGLLITYDNPYYEDVMNAIDDLANAPEIALDSDTFKNWYPIAALSLRHGNQDTVFNVYMNTDMDKYDEYPQSEADVYFRVNGMIHGVPVEKYVSYDSEVDALYDVQRLAKQAQIRRHCKNETEMEAYVFYVISPEIIELQADECGHFRILTDSDVSEIYNLANTMTPIHIYDIRPATREEAKGNENHPDIVGKVELIK